MRVRVIPFGVLKDWLGPNSTTIELPEGASVADLLEHLRSGLPANSPTATLQGIAVSVNAEYARLAQVLQENDEVGLLPPVSGGAGPANTARATWHLNEGRGEGNVVALTRDPIDRENLVAAAKQARDGAVVVFDGIVRDHSRGRQTLHLDYEAYEEMALRQMHELAGQACVRFAIRHVTIAHRLGRLEIGETSVLIIVASAHRSAAFDACRWLIDTLKTTVPIWKKETFVDGAVWAPGEPFPEKLAIDVAETKHEA